MNKNTMIINVNDKPYKLSKTSGHPDANSNKIENFAQTLATYKVAGHIVQLVKNYTYGEFVEYSLEVVTEWAIEKKWAYPKVVRTLKQSSDIRAIVDYVRDLVEKDKEFGKKLLNLD